MTDQLKKDIAQRLFSLSKPGFSYVLSLFGNYLTTSSFYNDHREIVIYDTKEAAEKYRNTYLGEIEEVKIRKIRVLKP